MSTVHVRIKCKLKTTDNRLSLPDAARPSTVPAVVAVGLGGGGWPLPGLTGECGAGLGGRRGGPDILFEAAGGKLPGTGGGGFLGGELGTTDCNKE